MFCPNCGNQMNDDAMFCGNCGWSKKANIQSESNAFKSISIINVLKNRGIFIIVGVLLVLLLFKIVSSFVDVASFAREAKKVEKQIKNGDFDYFIDNNIDYSDIPYTSPEEAKQEFKDEINEMMNEPLYGETSLNSILTMISVSDIGEKTSDISNEFLKAIDIKYSAKRIGKGIVRVNIKHNLPKPIILNNKKIDNMISNLLKEIISNMNSVNSSSLINGFYNIDKPIINTLKTYKGLSKDLKEEIEIYVDFYKIDGHWKLKLVDIDAGLQRIYGVYGNYVNEWISETEIIYNFLSKYNTLYQLFSK